MTRRVSVAVCVCALTLLACGRSENRADTTATAAPSAGATAAASRAPSTPAPAPVSLAQVEGKWQGKTMPATRDTVVGTWTLDAPQDTSKWVTTFTNGPKVPVHVVSIAGDSIVAQMGPYKSVTAKQAVTTRVINHIHGDTLVGTFEMHPVAKPDSVIRGRLQAVRAR